VARAQIFRPSKLNLSLSMLLSLNQQRSAKDQDHLQALLQNELIREDQLHPHILHAEDRPRLNLESRSVLVSEHESQMRNANTFDRSKLNARRSLRKRLLGMGFTMLYVNITMLFPSVVEIGARQIAVSKVFEASTIGSRAQ
jgi:hypothetical protein